MQKNGISADKEHVDLLKNYVLNNKNQLVDVAAIIGAIKRTRSISPGDTSTNSFRPNQRPSFDERPSLERLGSFDEDYNFGTDITPTRVSKSFKGCRPSLQPI